MTYFLIFFFMISCVGLTFAKEGAFFKDYMSKDATLPIKGFFVGLIIFSHYLQYIDFPGTHDAFYLIFQRFMGQLVVAMFLFYSGYGVYASAKAKSSAYAQRLLSKMLRLFLEADFIVLCFFFLTLILKGNLSIKHVLLSFVFWDSLGNSNWYIFAILFLYLFSVISIAITKKGNLLSLLILTILTILMILILSHCRDGYCYNTLLCYPAGALFFLLEPYFQKIVSKSPLIYTGCFLMLSILFAVLYNRRTIHYFYYEVWAVVFALLVVFLSMKIQLKNAFLNFLGKHIFEIYLLQRIPMILLDKKGTISRQPYLSFVICFITALFLAMLFQRFFRFAEGKITGFFTGSLSPSKSADS